MAIRFTAFVIVIILVIVFGFPELCGRFDFGNHRISFCFKPGDQFFSDKFLVFITVKYC